MAKDPAFLFYPGDYISGTMHLDFECKGAYVDLLMLQFQKDHMTLHMIKHVLGHRFEHIWPQISDKFKEDDGKFWNERLKKEKELRVSYCKSRKNNRNSSEHKNKHMSSHMSHHMEDINENINEDINKDSKGGMGEKEGLCYDIEAYLLNSPIVFEAICLRSKDKDVAHAKEVLRRYHLWHLSEDKYPKKPAQLIAGFEGWLLKPQNSKKGTYLIKSGLENGFDKL